MNFDIVIATRNRSEALKLSIPLILKQGRKPNKLIIVDASDDSNGIKKIIDGLVVDSQIKYEYIVSDMANSSRQRNLGLERVESPIVMFPDDDSLWWPDHSEAIMRIYERDMNRDIGGICGTGTNACPPDMNLVTDDILSVKIHNMIARLYIRFTSRFFPDPLMAFGRSCWGVRPAPNFLKDEKAVLVEWMGGFRMTFRSEIIKKYRFNEDLGAVIGWAACEDIEASFAVLQESLLVAAHDAKVYHYKKTGTRSVGDKLAFITHFNRAYVLWRYAPKTFYTRFMIWRYLIYRLLIHTLKSYSRFERERICGLLQAMRMIKELFNESDENLRSRYLDLCKTIIPRKCDL